MSLGKPQCLFKPQILLQSGGIAKHGGRQAGMSRIVFMGFALTPPPRRQGSGHCRG